VTPAPRTGDTERPGFLNDDRVRPFDWFILFLLAAVMTVATWVAATADHPVPSQPRPLQPSISAPEGTLSPMTIAPAVTVEVEP
jgi:hypothetical protein